MSSASSTVATPMPEGGRYRSNPLPPGDLSMSAVSDLDTPAVTVDLGIMEDNIRCRRI